MHRRFACLVLAALLTAPVAIAADEFPRRGAIILLGYDPEAPLTGECDKRAGTAGIVRVALVQDKPAAQRVSTLLHVAGLIGVARAVCPVDKQPPWPQPLTTGDAKLDPGACLAAKTAIRGGSIAKTIDTYVQTEHTDLATGFIAGVAEALAPIALACDPGEHWAMLKVESEMHARRAASMKERRACTLWRAAGFDELERARELAQSKGRGAGRARLERQAMTAIAGARHYCGKDGLTEAFEKTHYDLTVAVIDAAPENPLKKP